MKTFSSRMTASTRVVPMPVHSGLLTTSFLQSDIALFRTIVNVLSSSDGVVEWRIKSE